jgi:hypothetical protein
MVTQLRFKATLRQLRNAYKQKEKTVKRLQIILVILMTTVSLAQGILGTGLEIQAGGFLETFDTLASEFASYLLVGREDPWTGELKDGGYQLSNSSDEGVVKYIYTTTLTGVAAPLSGQTVSVDVAGTFASPSYSQAGLLFHFNPETQFYYAFVVKGNVVALVLRDANGFQELASTTADALKVNQVNRLSVVAEANTVRLLVNGAEVMSIDSPSLEPGGVGILAAGTGTFQFDNFLVEPATP